MNSLAATRTSTLHLILDGLGFGDEALEHVEPAESYRLDFERNFIIELHHVTGGGCRVSARIFGLGKSLQVQEKQIKTALNVFTEVQEDVPAGASPAIYDQDNSLRLCIELSSSQPEMLMSQFHEFLNVAFAFQQTCFQQQ